MISRIDKRIKLLLSVVSSAIVFIGLLLLLQTLFGRYGNDQMNAWLWFLAHTMPAGVLLFYCFLKNKVVAINVAQRNLFLYRLIFWATIFYIIALVAVLLIQPFLSYENTAIENLRTTDTALYIFQAMLICLIFFFIYKTRQFEVRHQSALIADENSNFGTGVFISYNHNNAAEAHHIKELLQKEGIEVIIDSEKMLAGEDIETFIERSVQDSLVTLSIISKDSLLSGWVASETINTFFLEKFNKQKRFIACYLDAAFLDRKFSAEAAKIINNKLEELTRQLDENAELGLDTRDLNTEITRLRTLKANIDLILERLRNSLCVDICNGKLTKNFPFLLKSIRRDAETTATMKI